MQIIDFHAHIYPDRISEKAVQGVHEFYKIPIDCEGTVSALLREGEKGGIGSFVVYSVATLPRQVNSINNFISGVTVQYSNIYGFGTIHAALEDPVAEIARCSSMGLKGIKIHPDTQQFPIDDPRMYPVYDYLQAKGIPIVIHCGDYRYDYSHPGRLARVLTAFPGLTVVGAHFGGWSVFDLALEYLEDKHCYLDISSSMMFLGKRRSKELIRIYGAERMLFGSDFPMWSPAQEVQALLSLGLTDRENEQVLSGNAERILNLQDR